MIIGRSESFRELKFEDTSMMEVFSTGEEQKTNSQIFKQDLIKQVYSVKSDINAIKEDLKGLKMRPSAAPTIKLSIEKKKTTID